MTRSEQELAQTVRARPHVDFPNGDRSYLIARRELDELVALAEAGERAREEYVCAHDHRWRMNDVPTRCPVCNTSSFVRAALGDGS